MVRKLSLTVLGVVVLFAAAGVLRLGIVAYTPPLTDDDGNALSESVAVLEKIELGGLEQWVLIRGADRSNPVLLWLHGGPGGAQMPFSHYVDRELERHFVVVHWDQRGAGKSNHGGFDEHTMHIERYIEDARELIEHLRRRLDADRIVLLGHSWGTRLGMHLIKRYPEHFDAYIGVSQTVSHDRATVIAHEWLSRVIDPEQAPDDWRALQAVEVPARRHADFRSLIRLVDAYGGSLDLSIGALARIAIRAPEYTALDYVRLVSGMNRGGGPMHEGGVMESFDFIETVPSAAVPIFFFAGAGDYNTPLALIEEFFEAIEAPEKELIVFERSAHTPFFAETSRFTAEVVRVAGR